MEQFEINEKSIANKFGHIKSVCKRFLYNPSDVELLFSESLEKIWVNKHRFVGNEADFNSWSYTVVYNLFLDSCRTKKRKAILFDTEDYSYFNHIFSPENIEKSVFDKELIDCMEYTVRYMADNKSQFKARFNKRAINDAHIKIFDLRFKEGLSYADISKTLNTPMGTIKGYILDLRCLLGKKT